MSRLIDHFPSWMVGGGIFATMSDMPWEDAIDGTYLDIEYFGNHSGLREASVLIDKMTCYGDVVLSDVEIVRLQSIIKAKFGLSWSRIWNALNAEYDGLNDISVTETRTPNLSDKRTPNLTETVTPNLTETRTPNLTETETPDVTDTRTPNMSIKHKASVDYQAKVTDDKTAGNITTSRHGFGSASKSPVSENDDTYTVERTTEQAGYLEDEHTGSDTTHRTGTDTRTKTGSETIVKSGTDTKTSTGTDITEHTGTETVERTGHTGRVQDTIKSEIELRRNNFFEIVFCDIDTILTRGIWK